MQLNSLDFSGFLGKDAEEETNKNGTRVVKFSICQTEKGKNGSPDISTWMPVKVYGGWCDYAATFKKGDNVYVRGPLNIYQYDKDGAKQTFVYVRAHLLAKIEKEVKSQQTASKVSGNSVSQIDLESIPF